MYKFEATQKLINYGLVAVVRGDSSEEACNTAKALIAGGIKIIEMAFSNSEAAHAIEQLNKCYKDSDVVIGAGTVLDPETARIAILSGAKFVVSPCLNADTAKICNRYAVLYIPGVQTPSDVVNALESGAEILKLFPGNLIRPDGLKALKAPFPQAMFMPTGGVSADNAAEWFKAGAVACGAGGNLTAPAKSGDFDKITILAKTMSEAVRAAKGGSL